MPYRSHNYFGTKVRDDFNHIVTHLVLGGLPPWCFMWDGSSLWCYMWEEVFPLVLYLGRGVSPGHPLVLYVRWVSRIGRCTPSTPLWAWAGMANDRPRRCRRARWREPGAPPTTLDPSSSQPNVNASRPRTQTQKTTTNRGATTRGKINCNCPCKCEQSNGGQRRNSCRVSIC